MAGAIKISRLARQEGGRGILILIASVATASLVRTADLQRQPFIGGTYASRVGGEERHYRIFQPAEYNTNNRKCLVKGSAQPSAYRRKDFFSLLLC
jgi:poly(3-hydroxybutyrate) depolymerase